MNGVAEEFSGALNRHIVYSDISPEEVGTGTQNLRRAGASDGAPRNDGRVAPGGSL